MILIAIRMKVAPEKLQELSQAVASLIGPIRSVKGCHRCDFYNSLEDEDEFCLLEEWERREDLAAHLKSELFNVLLGAMSLLKSPHQLKIYTGLPSLQPAGRAARNPPSPPLPKGVGGILKSASLEVT
jgi:quinol monooxygenase YgiN